jgi:xanthine dehydrogenase accessory factor
MTDEREPSRTDLPPREPDERSKTLRRLAESAQRDVWDTLVNWRAAGRRLALLSVIETRGFTPRKSGARMLLAEDGETFGTIGGGAIERECLEAARHDLAEGGTARTLHWHLTQELGMCCGGEMSVHVELVEPDPAVTIFGGGYIGRALALLAAGCGFRVTLVDERDEWADPAAVPGARIECRDPEAFAREATWTARDFVVIVTHQHTLDQRLVETLLRRPLRFLGMVGSIPKQRKFALRLAARGFTDADIARVRSPLGVAIGASTPEEIAVSIMAELIAERRGVDIGGPDAVPRRHGVGRAMTAAKVEANT